MTIAALVDLYMAAYEGRNPTRSTRLTWWTNQIGSMTIAAVSDDEIHAALELLGQGHATYYAGKDAQQQPIFKARKLSRTPATNQPVLRCHRSGVHMGDQATHCAEGMGAPLPSGRAPRGEQRKDPLSIGRRAIETSGRLQRMSLATHVPADLDGADNWSPAQRVDGTQVGRHRLPVRHRARWKIEKRRPQVAAFGARSRRRASGHSGALRLRTCSSARAIRACRTTSRDAGKRCSKPPRSEISGSTTFGIAALQCWPKMALRCWK